MSAFALEPLGPPAPCGFPRCTLESFHEGEHKFPAPRPIQHHNSGDIRICSECGVRFVIYGEFVREEARTCGSQACILARAAREVPPIPLACSCPQRWYAHELNVHVELSREFNNPPVAVVVVCGSECGAAMTQKSRAESLVGCYVRFAHLPANSEPHPVRVVEAVNGNYIVNSLDKCEGIKYIYVMSKHSKANCIGCELSLKDQGQCSRCRRCLDCCGNQSITGSCMNKYTSKTPEQRKRSDDAYDRWQANPAILAHNRRIN